ncbi:MAG: hypothetical protein AB1656_03500 [Candidatus Omnitrophota bacterium]
MNEKNAIHSRRAASEETWKRVNELIGAIEADKEMATPCSLEAAADAKDSLDRCRFRLLASIQSGAEYRHPAAPSLVERWTLDHRRKDWLTRLSETLNAFESCSRERWEEIRSFFLPLQSVLDILAPRLVPAPAHRGVSAAKERVYQPRRRAIEPADLPVFNPLFCAAIDPAEKTFSLSGLAPHAVYELTLLCVQTPDKQTKLTLHASAEGKLDIGFSAMMEKKPAQSQEPFEYVWLLEENSAGGAWTSGLIWLESEKIRALSNETMRRLADSLKQEPDDSSASLLYEINMLVKREYFLKAYERARQGLLFSSSLRRDESALPLKEALWQFVNQIVGKILFRIERAEPVFRALKPEWNAAASLRALHSRLVEWE